MTNPFSDRAVSACLDLARGLETSGVYCWLEKCNTVLLRCDCIHEAKQWSG